MNQQILRQMIQFNKTTFDNSFNAMLMLQEQTERMVNTLLQQATWLPEEGKKVLDEWVKAYKKGREDFKKTVDENFKRVEDFFADVKKPEAEKPDVEKPEAEKPAVKKAETKKSPKTKSK